MKAGFVHSVKVPRIYKETAKIVTNVKEQGASLKQLLFKTKKHPNVKGIYALALSTLKHSEQLNYLIRRTRILFENERLDPWLARVLITELLWGKLKLPPGSKPVDTILSYEKQLRDEANSVLPENQEITNEKQVIKPRYVRVNTLTTTVEETIFALVDRGCYYNNEVKNNYQEYLQALDELTPHTFIQDINIPELLVFAPKTDFHNYEGYKNGLLVLQDKASCLPSFLLKPPPGSVVLDMCAAPGMKTTHLAAMMQNQGKIYAVELNKERFDTLTEMLIKMNCSCVETINSDALQIDNRRCPDVEYILVDPSCSGSGMVDRLLNEKDEQYSQQRIRKLQSFQVMILTHALLAFPNVKRVVYSTCSIYPQENEEVVDEVLSKVGDAYNLVPTKKLLRGKWLNYSSEDYKCKDNCLYAKYDVDKTNGFFVAVFERNEQVPLPAYTSRSSFNKNKKKDKFERKRKRSDEEKHEHLENDRMQNLTEEETLGEACLENVENEEGNKNCNIEISLDEQGVEKKIKKKKKKSKNVTEEEDLVKYCSENIKNYETVQNCSTEQLLEKQVLEKQMKKKKKKSKNGTEEEDLVTYCSENIKNDETEQNCSTEQLLEEQALEKKMKKKKKKSKSQAEENLGEVCLENVENDNDERNTNVSIEQSVDDQGTETKIKKKKNKKRKIEDDNEVSNTIAECSNKNDIHIEEESTKKEKKKKRKKGTE